MASPTSVTQSEMAMEKTDLLPAIDGFPSSLPPDNKSSSHASVANTKSDSVGSNGQPPSKKWMESFKALKAYAQEHKHCRPSVSDVSAAVQFLARWAITQRKDYRLFCRGEKSPITYEKISLLQAIGFPFEVTRGEGPTAIKAEGVLLPRFKATGTSPVKAPPTKLSVCAPNKPPAPSIKLPVQSTWFTMFLRLCSFKKTHGHCCVTSRNPVLKAWLLSQLKDYKTGKLASCHRKLLLSIGFRFPTRFVYQDDEEDPSKRSESPVRPTSAWAPVKKKAKPEPPVTETVNKPTPTSVTMALKQFDGAPEAVAKPPETSSLTNEPNIAPAVVRSAPNGMPSAIEIWAGPPDDDLQENGGWPPGWLKRVFQRASGRSKGTFDAYWYPPNNIKKLRSMVEVRRHLNLPAKNTGTKKTQQRNKMPSLRAIHAAAPPKVARLEWRPSVKKRPGAVQPRRRLRIMRPKPGTQFTDEDWKLIRSHVPKQYFVMRGSDFE